MLDLLEKICTGFCGLVVLLVGTLYMWIGTPSTTPKEFIGNVREVKTPPKPRPPRQPKGNAEPPTPGAPPKNEDRELKAKLSKQGIDTRNRQIRKRTLSVPVSMYEYMKHDANWMKELKLASSFSLKTDNGLTRRKIGKISDSSLLKKLGFEEGDVLELVNGDIVEFSEQNALELRSMFKDAMEQMRRGEQISVTITRNNQPQQIFFGLPR